MNSQIQKSNQTQVFPRIEAAELRTYLREIFPTAKFRVQPRQECFSGATISISWAGPAPEQVREAVEDLEPGSCLFMAKHLMSGAPGPILPGGIFFFADREVMHGVQQRRKAG
jgi:hypothetical protein